MIVSGELMIAQLSADYSSPACKLGRMVANGEIIRLKRGLYETDPNTPPYLLAQHIYGPSYISFEYALMRHSIIPEWVRVVTCATFNKRRHKRFQTPLGRFSYSDVPEAVFDIGVEILEQDGRSYAMATAEKAVCDKLYKMPPTRTKKDLEALMYEDLRFDEDEILAFDLDTIGRYADLYRCTTIRTLRNYLEEHA